MHIPVMLNEVIDSLNIKPDGIYVDLTLGRAGHAEAILKNIVKILRAAVNFCCSFFILKL